MTFIVFLTTSGIESEEKVAGDRLPAYNTRHLILSLPYMVTLAFIKKDVSRPHDDRTN